MNLIGLSGLIQRTKFLVNENMPAILTGVGVAGTVTTAVLTGRASFKAAELIRQESVLHDFQNGQVVDIPQQLSRTSKAKLVWHLYLPPAVVGVTTVTSIVMANRVASTRIAALTVASVVSERRFQEYREKIEEKLGKREATKVRDEIAQERVLKNPHDTRQVIISGSGDVLCYDMLTGRYFMSSAEKIRKAENRINHELNNFMHASLSEFYEEVGLPPTTYTDMVGWNGNDNLEVQISTVLSDDEKPCLAIDFTPPPSSEYHKTLYD